MLETAGSLQHRPGEEGNSFLMRGCVLGMPEFHITTELVSSAATNSENHEVVPSIRRGKVSPWWEKVFFCQEIKWEVFPIIKEQRLQL